MREETGLKIDLDAPSLCYREVQAPDDGGDVRLHTLWVTFDATYAGGHLEVQPGELRGAAWLADPPGELGPWAQYRAADWWDTFDPADPWWAETNPDPYAETDSE